MNTDEPSPASPTPTPSAPPMHPCMDPTMGAYLTVKQLAEWMMKKGLSTGHAEDMKELLEELEDQLPKPTPAAPGQWRELGVGDVLQEGDEGEFYSDGTWQPISQHTYGITIHNAVYRYRRPLDATLASSGPTDESAYGPECPICGKQPIIKDGRFMQHLKEPQNSWEAGMVCLGSNMSVTPELPSPRAATAVETAKGREEKLLDAIHWLEGYFTMNIDGGGNHSCPWCYRKSENDGNTAPWSQIKHDPLCIIGQALQPTSDGDTI